MAKNIGQFTADGQTSDWQTLKPGAVLLAAGSFNTGTLNAKVKGDAGVEFAVGSLTVAGAVDLSLFAGMQFQTSFAGGTAPVVDWELKNG